MSYLCDMINLLEISEYAQKCYNDANCKYGDNNYFYHIEMVIDVLTVHRKVFKNSYDWDVTMGAAYLHDTIEDAKKTYNDILKVSNKDVADIVLAVTDVPAENRLMRHLLTMGKTVKDHRAIILKMCDMQANATYSKVSGSSMHEKYVKEYKYRKPIFQQALVWYKDELDQTRLNEFWEELDNVHNFK